MRARSTRIPKIKINRDIIHKILIHSTHVKKNTLKKTNFMST